MLNGPESFVPRTKVAQPAQNLHLKLSGRCLPDRSPVMVVKLTPAESQCGAAALQGSELCQQPRCTLLLLATSCSNLIRALGSMCLKGATQPLVPLVCCLAIGAGTALLPTSALSQHRLAVAVLAIARATAALWPSVWGGSWIAFCCGLLKVTYGCCAILRTTWDPGADSVLHFWVQPVISSLPWSGMVVAGSCIDWVILRRRMHMLSLALISVITGLCAAYPAWHKQCYQEQAPAAGCSYIPHAIHHVLLAMVLPVLCVELLPALARKAAHKLQHGTSLSDPTPSAGTRTEAVATAVAADTLPSAVPKRQGSDQARDTQQEQHATGSSTALTASDLMKQATGPQRNAFSWASWKALYPWLMQRRVSSLITACDYQPAFKRRIPVYVKMHGPLQPSDLPADLSASLQTALQPMNLCMLQMAVRAGCVCFSIEMLQLPSTAAAQPADQTRSMDSMMTNDAQRRVDGSHLQDADAATAAAPSDVARRMVELLLPAFDAALCSCNEQAAQQPKPKHDIVFQVVNELITAHWDSTASAWQLVPCRAAGAQPQKTTDVPRLRIGCVQQIHSNQGSALVPGSVQSHASASACYFSAPAGVCNVSGSGGHMKGGMFSSKASAHVLVLQLKLCELEGSARLSTAQLAGIVGYELPSSQGDAQAAQHEQVKADCFRLLAKCSNSYVPSHVMEVIEPHVHQQHPVVKFEVYVPDALLPRHCTHGTPVGLVSLVIELWQGEVHVGSAPVLVQLPAEPKKASVTALQPSCPSFSLTSRQHGNCWWWGTSGNTMQNAMKELQQLTAAVWHRNEFVRNSSWWHDFHDDLVLWLNHVRAAAIICGQCTSAMAQAPCTPLPPAQLLTDDAPDELAMVGKDLVAAARAWKLQHTVRMLQQQMSIITRACAQQKQAQQAKAQQQQQQAGDTADVMAQRSSSAGHAAWQDACTVLMGGACEACEQHCKQELSQLLAQLQVSSVHLIVSGGLTTSGLLRAVMLARMGHYWECALISMWGLQRLCLFLQQLYAASRKPAAVAAAAAWPRSSRPTHSSASDVATRLQRRWWWLLLLAYIGRQLAHVAFATGVVDASTKMRIPTLVINYVCVTLAEQAQISLLLPHHMAAVIIVCDVAVYMMLSACIGDASLYLLLLLVPIALLPRLALEAVVRARLRALQGSSVTTAITQQQRLCAVGGASRTGECAAGASCLLTHTSSVIKRSG